MKLYPAFTAACIFAGAFTAGAVELVRTEIPLFNAKSAVDQAENFRIRARLPEDLNRRPQEGAAVTFSFDKENLYVHARMTDSDLATEAKENQTPLGKFGDVFQLMLKPENKRGFWEILVAPTGNWTIFYQQGGGRTGLTPEPVEVKGFAAKVTLEGTLNAPGDRDKAWQVNLTIPLALFKGEKPEDMTVLVMRKNYSLYLPNSEISGFPQAGGEYDFPHYGCFKLQK